MTKFGNFDFIEKTMYPITLATVQDLDRILDLQMRAFHGQALIYNDFNLPALRQTLDDLKKEFREKTIYKLEMEGRLIGSVRCHREEDVLHIEKLIVDPAFQNRGIGTSMISQVEAFYAKAVKRYRVNTGDKSERNLYLYNKLGYREINRVPLNENCTLIHLEKQTENK